MTSHAARLFEHVGHWFKYRSALLGVTGWVSVAFVIQQVLRFGTSVALAWLLAPELLGTMLLINTLRTGGELLTDIGIGQSVVFNKKGATPKFYNTAWTIQIYRGIALFIIFSLASIPLSFLYESDALRYLLPLAATTFVISGLAAPARFLLQRRMRLKEIALVDIAVTVAAAAFQIAIAAISATIWALLAGLIFSTVLQTATSFALIKGKKYVIEIDKKSFSSITHFGKWIFISSIIYFASINFDRLYFADKLSMAALGVYGIARSLSDTIVFLIQRVSSTVIFPKVSSINADIGSLRRRLARLRFAVVSLMALSFSIGLVFSDVFVILVFDDRYKDAALFLPILLIGAWFSVLSALGDAIMMGVGKPSSTAWANGAKLVFVLVTVPFALATSFTLAISLLALSEVVRWAVLSVAKKRAGISFVQQDFVATLVFAICAIGIREVTGLIGLTGGLQAWMGTFS